ncbi:type II toxin-antitoxin system VapC family toxin [Cognataquiflexum aquatile]|jgi:predicted nucleic acid-binding protein|uniref:type II toxin-antitoxin system VapC family toxin n=1 Tax=Cognataquiflexum aquatile TaxID=2249427 RepID=UPI000DEBD653|nr:type II toxin-antitoxin system VapC family toxin [Cognataquiflexum aquatile]
MNVFFDTSSLFKLYHQEQGTQEILDFFEINKINRIYVSEIAKIEFASVIWRKCKMGEVKEDDAKILLSKFEIDLQKFTVIPFNQQLSNNSIILIGKYWKSGLRTLDSIQLASVIEIKKEIEYFFTSDLILKEISILEGLKTV